MITQEQILNLKENENQLYKGMITKVNKGLLQIIIPCLQMEFIMLADENEKWQIGDRCEVIEQSGEFHLEGCSTA